MMKKKSLALAVGVFAMTAALDASATTTSTGSFNVFENFGAVGPQALIFGNPAGAQGAFYNFKIDNFGAGDSYYVTGDEYAMKDAMMPGENGYGVGQTSWDGVGPGSGWNHTSQHVLIQLDEAVDLTITLANAPAALLPALNVHGDCVTAGTCAPGDAPSSLGGDLIPGFSLYQGVSTSGWNDVTHSFNNQSDIVMNADPAWSGGLAAFYTNIQPITPLDFYAAETNAGSANSVSQTYSLTAGLWSLWIGGTSANIANLDGSHGKNFAMTLSAAPVPVPGAAWLFGSALAGLVGWNNRRNQAIA